MGKFQNVNFEKPVVLKVAHGYNNKKIVLQLFKILRFSTRASALKIKNFIKRKSLHPIYVCHLEDDKILKDHSRPIYLLRSSITSNNVMVVI
jgi:hypothetical protein